MPVGFRTELIGAKEAVRSLNKLEPGLRKEFAAEATRIAQPAITEAQREYSRIGVPLSGMSRNWSDSRTGRKIFPYNPSKASRGVKIKLQGDRRVTSVILIEQRDAATAVWETAGRKTDNRLGNALGFIKPSTSRVLGPALFRRRNQVQSEMESAMLNVVRRVERELK
jgi:hypothetical protein